MNDLHAAALEAMDLFPRPGQPLNDGDVEVAVHAIEADVARCLGQRDQVMITVVDTRGPAVVAALFAGGKQGPPVRPLLREILKGLGVSTRLSPVLVPSPTASEYVDSLHDVIRSDRDFQRREALFLR